MIKIKDTLSSMVMAAPLTVAAQSALSPDAGAQRFDRPDNTKMVTAGAPWRLPDPVKASGTPAPASAQWYGARHGNTGQYCGIAALGVAPAIPRRDDSRAAWRLDDGADAQRLSARYNAGWRMQSAGYGFGGYAPARYTSGSGADIGLALQHDQTAGHRHPGNAASSAAMSPHQMSWTWTQSA